jgi:hypothetical protein
MKTAPVPAPTRTSEGDELDHIYCCDPDVALCGTDISGHEDNDADGTCIVCLDLEFAPCRC